MKRELLKLKCDFCGTEERVEVAHYGAVRCKCGRVYWALRPRRDGPMFLYLHPTQTPGVGGRR